MVDKVKQIVSDREKDGAQERNIEKRNQPPQTVWVTFTLLTDLRYLVDKSTTHKAGYMHALKYRTIEEPPKHQPIFPTNRWKATEACRARAKHASHACGLRLQYTGRKECQPTQPTKQIA